MSLIEEGLYLAGIEAAENHNWLASNQISHILTCDIWEQYPKRENVHYKFIKINDVPWEDLLHRFDECSEFIETVQAADGRILVHCQMGISRSATVTCAYLMRKYKIGVREALDRIKAQRSCVQPNSGFMFQLELYEKMGHRINPLHPEYKKFVLKHLVQGEKAKPDHLPVNCFLSDPQKKSDEASEGLAENAVYKCRKCRRNLFRSNSLMRHTIGQSELLYYLRPQSNQIKKAEDDSDEAERNVDCTEGMFVLPIQWMSDQIEQEEGKLNCPKCKAKLGTFCWSGMGCQCRAWITPAFHIQPSKIDECPSVQLAINAQSSSEIPNEQSDIKKVL